jgi:hypothetical protein
VNKLAEIHLGTSSFTAEGWKGSFYPRGVQSADRLTFYAGKIGDKVVMDRTEQLSWWVDYCYQTVKRGVSVYAYAVEQAPKETISVFQ